jgi:hypothetical protein
MGFFLFGPYFTTFLHSRQPAVYISHAIALAVAEAHPMKKMFTSPAPILSQSKKWSPGI